MTSWDLWIWVLDVLDLGVPMIACIMHLQDSYFTISCQSANPEGSHSHDHHLLQQENIRQWLWGDQEPCCTAPEPSSPLSLSKHQDLSTFYFPVQTNQNKELKRSPWSRSLSPIFFVMSQRSSSQAKRGALYQAGSGRWSDFQPQNIKWWVGYPLRLKWTTQKLQGKERKWSR